MRIREAREKDAASVLCLVEGLRGDEAALRLYRAHGFDTESLMLDRDLTEG